MTQDDIIEMARESGMDLYGLGKDRYRFVHHLEAFAKLVRDDYSNKHAQLWLKRIDDAVNTEREEIVEFIESTNLGSLPEETALHYARLLRAYSTAIRARGKA